MTRDVWRCSLFTFVSFEYFVVPHESSGLVQSQGHRLVGSAQPVGWDQRRFAALAHHDFSMFPAWWAGARSELVPPYVKKAMALLQSQMVFSHFGNFGYKPAPNLGSRA